ncbi:hypothetical protein M569_13626, partial [Genlisea aurea]
APAAFVWRYSPYSFSSDYYTKILGAARENFTREISFPSKDQDVSLAKALLHVGTEDEAFLALNREIDKRYFLEEHGDVEGRRGGGEPASDGEKNVEGWLQELDSLAGEAEGELVSRDIGCHTGGEIIEAVNKVLFESRGFKRSTVPLDPKCSYLHSALRYGLASAIMLSVIYIEVCRRLRLTIVGSRVGEEFLIWPSTGNPE